LVEETAFDRNFGVIANGKLYAHASSTDSNELDAAQFSVWRTPNPFRQFQAPENWPAGRIQAIAANFLARKFFALDDRGPQTGGSAKSGAARTGRPASDDRDIEHAAIVVASWVRLKERRFSIADLLKRRFQIAAP
jgi:hypothetical protein